MKLDVSIRVVGGHGAVRMGVTLAVGLQDQTYGGPLVIMFGAFGPGSMLSQAIGDRRLHPESGREPHTKTYIALDTAV